ncbi:unnamed protein product (macronuclear) [Paramecium tetraurelia]|uniref:adenylate cyclase n=1 Tax=Paramecium tetraurelia TaxID=5888 RepID=A0CJU6_PARTE|nr:uncharacterized protein GSPATT00000775001 [Paramecium tetraurelia]CAK71063.1 unnamed protein product [Paramecium tetraurelia]|eukprot:XP_001438460.1 hypothetical protein (macronuclear) [Paramecium tetraurelia strain d4-2]
MKLVDKILRTENLIILIILIIALAGNTYTQDSTGQIIVLFTLICYLLDKLQYLINLLLISYQRWKQQSSINNNKCRIFQKFPNISDEEIQKMEENNQDYIEFKSYLTIKWCELQVGQIVCLKHGKQSPADLLILDSSQEQVLADYELRIPCPCTFVNVNHNSKGNIMDFITKLNGSISFTVQESITGSIKLKNDPKATSFNKKNMIMRGEIMDRADWIFGLAIRVGDDCRYVQTNLNKQSFQSQSWLRDFHTQIVCLCGVLFSICFIPNIIYSSLTQTDYFFDSLIYCLLIFPQALLLVEKIWYFCILLYNNQLFEKHQIQQALKDSKQTDQKIKTEYNHVTITSQNERKILMPIKKKFSLNLIPASSQLRLMKHNSNKQNISGFLALAPQNILDLIQTDIIVFENPQHLFKESPKVVQLVQNFKNYQFNYDKLKDLVTKASPQHKTNCDKMLIDTNRQQTQDEMKTLDIEMLIQEKRVPDLRSSQESFVSTKQIKKLQFMRKDTLSDFKQQEPKLANGIGKKKSSRFIFDQSFAAKSNHQSNTHDSSKDISNNNGSQSFQSPPILKQKSQFNRQGTQFKNNSSSFQNSQSKLNEANQDRLIGDILNEQDFIDVLYSKDDTIHNEILIMMLITNSVMTLYNEKLQKLEFNFENKYDQSILQFTELFDYCLVCATEIENSRPEFNMKTIIKKVITISNISKIFDVLTFLEPTENRKNTLSVLVRDPESFLLDEGALLYSRIETSNYSQQENKYNEFLSEMSWDGQKTFLYTKKQLDQTQTDEFLKKLSAIYETYGNRSHEIEKLFIELEQQSEPMFSIGIKSHNSNCLVLSSQELNYDILDQDKIFQHLYNFNLKTCFITQYSYDELLIFLRSFQIIRSREQIVEFKEKDKQQLQFKVKQHIQALLENQNANQNEEQFIIVSSQAFNTIIKDDYLKYHFIFIVQFSFGLGAYQLNSVQKGKLIKLLKMADKKILTVGNSLDNGYMFSKSDVSVSLLRNKSLVSTLHPKFVTSNMKQLFRMLFIYCPKQMLNYLAIIEVQLYRCTLIGLTIFAGHFELNDINMFYLLLFYLIPSNLLSSVQYYYLFVLHTKQQLKNANNYARLLQNLKNKILLKSALKIILIAIIDFFILILIHNSILNFVSLNGRVNQTQQIILLYLALEILEKSKIIFYIFSLSTQLQQKIIQICLNIVMVTILIIIYNIIQTIEDDQMIIEEFDLENFVAFIFIAVFVLGLSYIFYEILQIFSIQFVLPSDLYSFDQNYQEIKSLRDNISSQNSLSEFEDEKLRVFNQKLKQLTDQLFDNKDIIEECIIKQIKGDQSLIDEMDKLHGFQDKKTESSFQDFFREQNNHRFNIVYAFIFYDICIINMYLYQIFTEDIFQFSILITTVIQFVIQIFIAFLQFRVINDKKNKQNLQILSYILRFLFQIIIDILYFESEQTFVGYIFNYSFILAFSMTTQPKIPILLYVTLQLINYVINLLSDGFTMTYSDYTVLIFCIAKYSLLLLEVSYPVFQMVQKTHFLQRSFYIYQNRLNNEKKKINNILGLLMPRFIQERMNKGQIQISQDQGDVTVLFCDIYQFDKVIKFQQENILDFLDTLYRAFDQLCQTYDLQKIETVGKTYMAAGGLKDYDAVINQKNSNSTTRALETAIAMMETVKTMKYGDNQDVKLKIGIHYGRVIAGVIGFHKPQFSLIGDTVNTTSRVCSTSDAGFITLSESAYNHIKDTTKHQFEQKSVAAKGKGTLETFRLKICIKEKDPSKSITPKACLDKNDKNFELDCKVQIMPLKNSDNSKTPLKGGLRRTSLMNQTGIPNDTKAPLVLFKQISKDIKNKQQPSVIIKKKSSIEHDCKDLDLKRLNSQKSKSGSNLDNDNQSQIHQKAKTPALISTMRNSINTHRRLIRQSEDGTNNNNNNGTLQQISMTHFSQIDLKTQPQLIQSHIQTNQSPNNNQQPIINSFQQASQNQLLLIAEHPSKESLQQEKNEDEVQIPQQQVQQQIQRPQLKKKGTIIMVDLVQQKKSCLMKSNTRIMIPEEKDKDRVVKIAQIDNDQQAEQVGRRQIIKQKSIKPIQQEPSDSAIKKYDSILEKFEELEVNKRQGISMLQKKLDLMKLKNIKKFKLDFDKDYDSEQFKSYYDSKDQIQYYQIYEEYKDQELIKFRSTFSFLLVLMIFKSLLYFLLENLSSKSQIELLITVLCQISISLGLAIPIYKYREQSDILKIKTLGFIYFITTNLLNLLLIQFSEATNYQVILQTCQITSIYVNLFYLQMLIVPDKYKLLITYIILIVLVTVYEQFILEILFFGLSIIGITFYSQHQINQILVKNYKVSQQLQIQIAKYENMLQYLMPPHALKRLLQPDQDNTETFIDVLENATVLFADIAGFTKYSSSVEPETVVEMLRNLFQTFDEFCQMTQVYKLFTIGDCYVCMGVMDLNQRDPAEEAQNVLVFGLKMIQIINDCNKDPQYQHLNMRIGVHTGKVLGGVVGTDVVRYDIYGEDVTIANLMESSGSEGKMLVSEHTKNLVESVYEDFKFEYAKDVYIPSKDITLPTFFVQLNDLVFSQEE